MKENLQVIEEYEVKGAFAIGMLLGGTIGLAAGVILLCLVL